MAEEVRRGRPFRAAGVGSFVREGGAGDPVVLMHGLPSSSFLYRKVIDHLAAHGLRGVAFDLPGLGLAERPGDFDYTFAGLGRWAAAALDQLGLDRFHLVVHDAGGPVGFEMVTGQADRVRSLTLLNTVVAMDSVVPDGGLRALRLATRLAGAATTRTVPPRFPRHRPW